MSNTFDFEGYTFKALSYADRNKPGTAPMPESEGYVTVPPAARITDREGNVWTLGFQRPSRDPHRTGEYEFDVVRNRIVMGEWACRIEYRAGKVRIFGQQGWRTWNGKTFI